MTGFFRSFFIHVYLVTAAAGTTATTTGTAGIAVAVTSTGTAAFTVRVSTFGVGAVYRKTLTMLGVIHEINSGISEIINGYIVNDNLNAIGIESGIHIAEIIIESHPEIHATATTTCNVHAQGITFEIALFKNIFNSLAGRGS